MHCCAKLNDNGIPTALLSHKGISSEVINKRYQLWEENNHCMHNPSHEENPTRILALYHRLMELEDRLLAQVYPWNDGTSVPSPGKECKMSVARQHKLRRFLHLPCTRADRCIIELAHSPEHYEFLKRTTTMSASQLQELSVIGDLYFNNFTFVAATLAAGAVIECVKAVTDFKPPTTRAIALVRPPGHHAAGKNRSDRYDAQGFCYFNNVAIASKYAIASGRASRVFILDWDIHHGNGIQDLTYDDPNIFYLSLHRNFYPYTGRHDETGKEGDAAGTNCNIVWDESVGNADYAAAFSSLVLPSIMSYGPDLILISSGLDAAKGDRIGDCFLTPPMYYALTNSILATAGQKIPIVVVLEGGYNLKVIADCVEGIALALFDEPWKEDRTQYESKTFWSTNSILPVTSRQVLQQANPFSLNRWIGKEPLNGHTLSSISRTSKALKKAGRKVYSLSTPMGSSIIA